MRLFSKLASLKPGIKSLFIDNPVLVREMRSRMRGLRMTLMLTIFTSIACIVVYLVSLFMINDATSYTGSINPNAISMIGTIIFYIVLGLVTFIVLFFSPMMLSGVVAGEKEKKTFDFIRVTTLSPWRYLLGFILSNVLFITLILFCTFPAISLSYIFGGVSFKEVLAGYFVLVCWMFPLSAFGLMMSVLRKNVKTAQTSIVGGLFGIFFFMMSAGSILSRIFFRYAGRHAQIRSLSDILLGSIPIGNINVPNLVIIAGVFGYLFAFFYIIPARKLFKPYARALSYPQFFILACIFELGFILTAWGGLDEKTFFIFLIISSIWTFGAIFNFVPDVVQIGDETWKIRKKHKFFRKYPEGALFVRAFLLFQLLIITACWYFQGTTPKQMTFHVYGVTALTFGHIVVAYMLLLFVVEFFIGMARFFSAVFKTRKSAVWTTLLTFMIVMVIIPVLLLIVYASLPLNKEVPAALLKFTPQIALAKIFAPDLFRHDLQEIDTALSEFDPMLLNIVLFGFLTVVVNILAIAQERTKKKHYEWLYAEEPFEVDLEENVDKL